MADRVYVCFFMTIIRLGRRVSRALSNSGVLLDRTANPTLTAINRLYPFCLLQVFCVDHGHNCVIRGVICQVSDLTS